jgi:DNA repair exonuclease SbcCD ATPase subunit
MSVGNVTQGLRLDQYGLTLVLGNNMDLGGDGARNGVGKTTIVNAICYALYGAALTNIRRENLINKTNGKTMLVTVEFEKNGSSYKIVRGRKPNVLHFYVNDHEVNEENTDEGQGENRVTQEAIDRIIGMSPEMFKHLVALNTYTQPFLALRTNDQRNLIEELLGITQLSEKADILKELIRGNKDNIKDEEVRIKTLQESNLRVQQTVDDLERRSRLWTKKRDDDMRALDASIQELEVIDINQELAAHKLLESFKEKENKIKLANKELSSKQSAVRKTEENIALLEKNLVSLEDHKCHACGQELHDEKHEGMLTETKDAIVTLRAQLKEEQASLKQVNDGIKALTQTTEARPTTRYGNIEDAAAHRSNLENLKNSLVSKDQETDPYREQIDSMKKTALVEISWDHMNELTRLLGHQEFLLKLLTNKDSFVRKRIIEQNLAYLNHRLGYYLAKLSLPHEVVFKSDLEVDITQLGQSFDFDNLSRGERNRLILALSWSFRDVYESFTEPMNLLFIDELVDSGMDQNGIENAMAILKAMGREMNRNVFLISHKDELASRVNNVLMIVKENGFTSIDSDTGEVII